MNTGKYLLRLPEVELPGGLGATEKINRFKRLLGLDGTCLEHFGAPGPFENFSMSNHDTRWFRVVNP